MRLKSSSAWANIAPNTASASDFPKTCAIPQSSRTMVTFRACFSQRAAAGGEAAISDPAVNMARSGNRIARPGLSRSRPMRLKEGTYLAHRQRNPLLGLLPWEYTHLGLWREHRGLHGDGVRMRRDIIRQDQYGCLAIAHEIACHGEDEVGVRAVHLSQKFVDHLYSDFGTSLDQFRPPALHIGVVKKVTHLRTRSAGLRQHGCDNAIRSPPQQVPDEGAANAESQHHELLDAEVIH